MVTEFGKYLRHFRLTVDERLYDMAKKLNVSSAILSYVETGKKAIPSNLKEKIISCYQLSSQQIAELENAILASQARKKERNVSIKTQNENVYQVAAIFARKCDSFSPEQLCKLREVMEENSDD